MLDNRSTQEADFQSHGDEGLELDLNGDDCDRSATNPAFSVETLMEGRSAYEAVFEDETWFLRR